ncbi:MAG: RnfABCDGE type electron transport complex subunit D [Candidatus Omnitrophica bacterium CG22_combo_CG10-13_8_21_14_all_43_16]|nr:MAG: RnfABCDGE type electron transport complex subunit D [Candidatus Omnitrophica bacterium CG22_combo_CG10-13_8_21_14_all_43_16]
MRFIKNTLDQVKIIAGNNKYLKTFKPVLNAMDGFFFGTDKVTALPHIVDNMDIKRLMSLVIIALLPVTIASIYFWGLRVLLVIMTSYIFGGLIEVCFAVFRKKEIHEGFLVTGLIFPLILPPGVPLWVVAVGVMFGVMFGKEVFGGTGRNIFNPAIVGRVFLTISFPKIMTINWQLPFNKGLGGFTHFQNTVDAVTTATPLVLFKNQGILTSYSNLMFGQSAGCIGETFRIAIIAGGLFLIVMRIVDWRLPLAYLATVFVFPYLSNHLIHTQFALGPFQLLSGGLLLGAFFMATDPVTSPFTRPGKWISGALLGILTLLIRNLSGYVEGVMFSILLINAFAPLIDTMVLRIRYKKR